MPNYDIVFKVCIFGDGGVGKTTLVNRYITGVFKESTKLTIGVDFYTKHLKYDDLRILLQIWDFAGEERFRFLLPSYLIGASGGIFMYDITRYSSLQNYKDWISIFKEKFNYIIPLPLLMVGGKSDLLYKRSVLLEDAKRIMNLNHFHDIIECSAKTGENVEEIFLKTTKMMLIHKNLLKKGYHLKREII